MPNEIELQLTINAPPQDVYRALTEGDQLEQWFAEHADVSMEDGRYGFWGRLTPEHPDRPQGRLLEAIPNEKLRFEWTLRGEQTEVTLNFREKGAGSRIRLKHFGIPNIRPGQYAVADFWSLSMDNLRAWVERGEVGLQCDFGAIKLGGVRLEVDIDAPPEEVFSTLIDPEKLSRYIANDPVVEPVVGGRYDYGWGDGPTKILDLEPN
ncbi:MAG: SRPBCC family protein [Chloroflexi bacterium]|nr:SRPBCC family protein [Chloroflexota bacterium]